MSNDGLSGEHYSLFDRLLRWRLFPVSPHVFLYIFLAAIIYFAFAPGQRGEGNLATETVWKLWWPLLPFVVLFGGRLWCGICPFGGIADLAGHVGRRAHAPRLVRHVGPWLGIISVFCFGLAFLALGLEANAGATGWILIGMVVVAAALALLFRGRTFCRYLCPVGLITRAYSFVSFLQPRGSNKPVLTRKNCPVGMAPARLTQPGQCHLCGNCTQTRDDGGIITSFGFDRPRTAGRLEFARPEVFLSLLLLTLMAADSVRMTSLFARYQQAALPLFDFNYRLAVVAGVVLLIASVSALISMAILAAGLSRAGATFNTVGFASLPLTLGVFLSLAMQHLWSGAWPSVQTLLVEFRLLEWTGHMPPTNVYFFSLPLKLIQFGLLGTGLYLSLRWTSRLRSESGRDQAVEINALFTDGGTVMKIPASRRLIVGTQAATGITAAAFGLLFLLPMSGAC
ncbi:MAG: 4Fe-4S binding protein [Thermoleophilia bacterium]|nr:4Fe-4S binding protein [Thermoleophilia bacterium]